ncbi:Rho GTPase-activating protein 9, partial [Halocaridina rubra]
MNQQAEKLNKAVRKLPPENYDTLRVLLQHLLRVTDYESDNRMSISNLAIVFGPCLLWPKFTTSCDLMTDVMLHNRVVEGLLSDFAKVFPLK